MKEFVIWLILFAVFGGAIYYIIQQKRKGVKCVGCASSGSCSNSTQTNTPCNCSTPESTNTPCNCSTSLNTDTPCNCNHKEVK